MMIKLVSGLGFNSRKYPSYIHLKATREYSVWGSMLERCTEKLWIKRPTYTGTTCSDNFKSFTFFHEWCQNQIGFNTKDESGRYWHLDKDLLVKGNKVYSEDTCVFVPLKINSLLTKCDVSRGGLAIGVFLSKQGKFQSQCNNGKGRHKHLGLFNTPQEAFQAYKTFKEALIKEVANEYRELLDKRVYEALMNYEVNIND